MSEIAKIGVAVIVHNGLGILLGKRKGSHGAGSWSFPGGHLEAGETVAGCAYRELLEETAIAIPSNEFAPFGFSDDVFFDEGKHYVTLYMGITVPRFTTALLREPDKCDEWGWWEKPPEPLFLPVRNLLAAGFNPWSRR